MDKIDLIAESINALREDMISRFDRIETTLSDDKVACNERLNADEKQLLRHDRIINKAVGALFIISIVAGTALGLRFV